MSPLVTSHHPNHPNTAISSIEPFRGGGGEGVVAGGGGGGCMGANHCRPGPPSPRTCWPRIHKHHWHFQQPLCPPLHGSQFIETLYNSENGSGRAPRHPPRRSRQGPQKTTAGIGVVRLDSIHEMSSASPERRRHCANTLFMAISCGLMRLRPGGPGRSGVGVMEGKGVIP